MPRSCVIPQNRAGLRRELVFARLRRHHPTLRCAARCDCSRAAVSALWSQKAPAGATRARLQRACEGSSSAFPAPRCTDTETLRSEVPPTSAGGRRSAEHREISQFSALPKSIRRPPSVKQTDPAARRASPGIHGALACWPSARSSGAARAVAARVLRAQARNARRRAATRARLHIPCHRVMRCCVGVAAILTVASAIHRPRLRNPAPRRTLRHLPGRGIERPVLGNPDAGSARGFTGTCASAEPPTWASAERARSPARRASPGS
jgi:hypothetical protein